jgi:hypothetical protein
MDSSIDEALRWSRYASYGRDLALGYARTEVNKSYLFSYIITHDFLTPQVSDEETESIFTIAFIDSPRFLIIRYFGWGY